MRVAHVLERATDFFSGGFVTRDAHGGRRGDLTVARDKESDTLTRYANYTAFDASEGAKPDVIQCTEDGISRSTTRTLPNGEGHSRSVDVTCEKDVGKCVKQVEVDRQS
jgi:hypothetical protein